MCGGYDGTHRTTKTDSDSAVDNGVVVRKALNALQKLTAIPL